MISEATRKNIILLIWRGFGSLDIVSEFTRRRDAPPGDRAEREISDAVSELRTQIEELVRDLRGGIVEAALRKGFGERDVLDGILNNSDLIPQWDLQVLVSGVKAKIDAENKPAKEAAEKAEADARKAAIQKRIDDAKAALRKMGLPVGE